MNGRLRRLATGGALLALAAAGCSVEPPLARGNPFDPNTTADFWIAGPDSVQGNGTRFVMRLEGTGTIPPGSLLIGWRSSHPLLVAGGGGGEFMLMGAPTEYVPVLIRAELGEDIVFVKTVYVRAP